MAKLLTEVVPSAPSSFTPGPIDLEHVSRQALGDTGLAEEILLLYTQMSRLYLERIETSTSIAELLPHLHTLKAAAAGIGAWAVRDLARSIEDGLLTGAPVNPELIADLAMTVQECNAFIEAIQPSAAH
ncbi:Hpt domain-containing protein [Devosia sp.]|uniref:Hpt domain-containing protein n=1 Tax=Devosia sp. TaxID=1871048 RepID=UPI003BA9D0F8